MVQMFGTVTGVTVLAVADRQYVSGHGGEIVASPGSSVGGLSARGTRPERQEMIHFLLAIWAFLEQFIVYWTGSIGRDCVRMFVLTWHHVRFVWPGSLVSHEGPPRKSVCVGNGGLFFSMDGSLPAA